MLKKLKVNYLIELKKIDEYVNNRLSSIVSNYFIDFNDDLK
jgi:hypothetical protein